MPKKNGKSKDLPAKTEESSFAVARLDPEAMQEILKDNLGGQQIREFDLDRIKVPSGGGTTWTIPDLEKGEVEAKEIEGVIVFWSDKRAFWPDEFSGESNPPACSSADGVTGRAAPDEEGKPACAGIGGDCAVCPMNSWGSDPKGGKGKACKEMIFLFMVGEDDMLPFLIVLPPMSLKPYSKYAMRLAMKGRPYWSVMTKLTLRKEKNAGGIFYSQVVPTFAGALDEQEKEAIRAYSHVLRPYFSKTTIDRADVEHVEN